MKIVLISCVSKKLPYKARARELYNSPLFKYALKYAEKSSPEKIFVLSAKYGLIEIDKEIEPYEQTLNKMKDEEIKKWSEGVVNELKKNCDLERDQFIILAGQKYRKHLTPELKNHEVPMKNLGIGKQLKFLKERTK